MKISTDSIRFNNVLDLIDKVAKADLEQKKLRDEFITDSCERKIIEKKNQIESKILQVQEKFNEKLIEKLP